MMDDSTEQMSAELADELASNERRLIDPRTVPVRFHHLKCVAQSPAHAFSAFQEGSGRDSLALRLGAGVHAMLFELPVVMWTGKVRRGKDWDAFSAEHAGKVILPRKAWNHATEVVAAVKRHPIAMQLLFGPGTVREQTITWSLAGRARRSTPDARGPYHVAELKTTRCAEMAKFTRDAGYRFYHAQLADQCLAIEAETGTRPSEVYCIAVETVKPYVVTVMQLTSHTVVKGERLITAWMARLLECERTNAWPGYSEQIEMLDIPDDAFDTMFVDTDDAPAWSTDDGPA